MLRLTGNWLKIIKGVHIFAVCCWLGAGLALLVLTLAKYAGWVDGNAVYGLDLAAHIADRWVVVNMGAFTCLGTGLVYGALTGWGFFRHGWIVLKWIAIIGCIFFGMWLGGREREMLELSRQLGGQALSSPDYLAVQFQYAIGVIAQVVVIITVIFLSIFRPWKGRGRKRVSD